RVDQLLKAGSLEEARAYVTKAKEVDPRNIYVSAYEERLNDLLEEKAKRDTIEAKRQAEQEQRRSEDEARRKLEEETRKAEEEKRKAEEEKRKAEEEKRSKGEEEKRRKAEEKEAEEAEKRKKEEESKAKVQSKSAARRSSAPEIPRSVLEETKRKILEERKGKSTHLHEMPPPGQFQSTYEEGLEIYRRVLFEVWVDGASTPAEKKQLASLQASLMISPEDHTRLERDAKIDSYTSAFRRAWSSGAISPESASLLADLRKKFSISMEDHEQIEATLLWELRSSNQKAQLLVIDDDQKLLTVISDTLQDAGFQTIPVTTSDEAFKILQTVTPDLILSDINLETSTMGGFSFYEKVREIERLHEIPFIFLSGLTDEVLIRTGKELGVDDYITKPFSSDNLIATIKGKIKRYRQMKKKK
ncbi:MAG: response regulator, partial [Bacteroidota bacterium]